MSDPYLNCPHCGDQCACRATREEFDEALKVISELLKGGQHEGPCDYGQVGFDSCSLHVITAKQRDEAARAFLEAAAQRRADER